MNKFSTFLLLFFGLIIGPWLHAQTVIDENTMEVTCAEASQIEIPCGVTVEVTYQIWGGGGSGGRYNATRPTRAATGGGGGGYSTGTITLTAGIYDLVCGAGGVLTGPTDATTRNGGNSSFNGVTSNGGRGGSAGNSAGAGGAGAAPGGAGGGRDGVGNTGGGGGGGGSGPAPVTDGGPGTATTGGAGGTPNGGDGGASGANGMNGTFPGGGGGGKGSTTGGLVSGNGADGQVLLTFNNYNDATCYPTTTACAEVQPGIVNTNPTSCDIAAGEPMGLNTTCIFDCANATAVTFDTPVLPADPSVLYHYWGNCATPGSMPTGIAARTNGYIQQMFCGFDDFGLPAFPDGLSPENGTIDFIPQQTEDVGCSGFAEAGTSCVCGGGGVAGSIENTGTELIQLDFWMAVPGIQPQVGFRLSGARDDAGSFFVGPDLENMCEVAYFTDGTDYDGLAAQTTGTYNIDAAKHAGTCGLLWVRVRVYISDVSAQFRVNPQIYACDGWVSIDELVIKPALSVDDNVPPNIDIASTTGYLVEENGQQFLFDDQGIWDPYGCTPLVSATDDGVCNLAPLPVELISFDAFLNNKQVTLKWETAAEVNNAGFEIQKSSNGRDWEILDWVHGNGTTSEINTYEYLDKTPIAGDNYYRLKQVDYDGQFEFSDIVIVRYKVSGIVVEISPNPSPGDVKVTVLNPEKEKMSIELYDSSGLLIWQSGTLAKLDTWKKKFSLTQREMYFISVQVGKEIFTKKILIIDSY